MRLTWKTARRGMHLVLWVPLVYWGVQAALGQLTVNPIQALTQRTGLAALTLLMLTLACTPAARWLGRPPVLSLRRTLGLYTFFYATVHLLLVVGLDYGLRLGLFWQEMLSQKPFIQVGLAAYALLALLAGTSFPPWPARLGRRWKTLHRLVYLVGLLVLVHYAWAVKGSVTRFQGNILGVVGFASAYVMLMLARLPLWAQGSGLRGRAQTGGTKNGGPGFRNRAAAR